MNLKLGVVKKREDSGNVALQSVQMQKNQQLTKTKLFRHLKKQNSAKPCSVVNSQKNTEQPLAEASQEKTTLTGLTADLSKKKALLITTLNSPQRSELQLRSEMVTNVKNVTKTEPASNCLSTTSTWTNTTTQKKILSLCVVRAMAKFMVAHFQTIFHEPKFSKMKFPGTGA